MKKVLKSDRIARQVSQRSFRVLQGGIQILRNKYWIRFITVQLHKLCKSHETNDNNCVKNFFNTGLHH